MNNEITRSKIIYICGSIEAFIENPNILRERLDQVKEPSLEWMRTVSPEEAKIAHENLKKFWEEQAQNPRPLNGGALNERIFQNQGVIQTESVITESNHNKTKESKHSLSNDEINELLNQLQSNSVGHNEKDGINLLNYWPSEDEWNNSQSLSQYDQEKQYEVSNKSNDPSIIKAKSPETAWQMNWKTPTDFLCCPNTIGNNPIEEYYNQIVIGGAYNSTIYYGRNEVQEVIDKAHTKENTIIVLSCNLNSIKPYALCRIHYFEGKFIHESLGTFFEEDGGRKYFTLEQGLEWAGEDPFDDYC